MNSSNQSAFFAGTSNDTWEDEYLPVEPTSGKAVKITILLTIMFMCLVGNFLIVAVVVRKRELRTPMNYLLLNMAVSDMLIPVFVLPADVTDIFTDELWLVDGVLGSVFCVLSSATDTVSATVSILSMTVIAIDRFYSVIFAMRPALISNTACLRLIVVIWVIAVTFSVPSIYGTRLEHNVDSVVECVFVWDPEQDTEKAWMIHWIVFAICLTVLPLMLLTILYGAIIVFLFRQKLNLFMASETLRQRTKENRKVACMLVTVVVIFAASWIPFHIGALLEYLAPESEHPPGFVFAANYMPYVYTALNPVVYYVFSEKYRRGFREVLCRPFHLLRAKCFPAQSVAPTTARTSASVAQSELRNECTL